MKKTATKPAHKGAAKKVRPARRVVKKTAAAPKAAPKVIKVTQAALTRKKLNRRRRRVVSRPVASGWQPQMVMDPKQIFQHVNDLVRTLQYSYRNERNLEVLRKCVEHALSGVTALELAEKYASELTELLKQVDTSKELALPPQLPAPPAVVHVPEQLTQGAQ